MLPRSLAEGRMLKIQRSTDGGAVRFTLSGRIEGEHLAALQREIANEPAVPTAITLDLEGVRLVDREAIAFLVECAATGIRLANCPRYVDEWIARERTQ